MSVIGRDDDLPPLDKGPLAALYWENEAERLRAEWRKADDGWIACRQQLEGAVERVAKLEAALIAQEREMNQLRELAGVRRRYHDATGGSSYSGDAGSEGSIAEP
jgi:hypothetical protein